MHFPRVAECMLARIGESDVGGRRNPPLCAKPRNRECDRKDTDRRARLRRTPNHWVCPRSSPISTSRLHRNEWPVHRPPVTGYQDYEIIKLGTAVGSPEVHMSARLQVFICTCLVIFHPRFTCDAIYSRFVVNFYNWLLFHYYFYNGLWKSANDWLIGNN